MAALLRDIMAELDRVLEPGRFDDYGPNGLQVPGREEVHTVATGVSAHAELFELAAHAPAQLVLVHHGLFWGSGPGPIDALLKRRLEILFDAGMSLAAYHLPLDAHPQLGNNALLAHALGAAELEPFAPHRHQPIGCIARLEPSLPARELFARVARVTERPPLVFDSGPAEVARLAVVSGAGNHYIAHALAAHADAFLTGEPTERVMAQAREGAIHYIAAGHHATETFGIRALGQHLAQRFPVRHLFLDVPNPV